MSINTVLFLIFIAPSLLWAIVSGLLAARKNRDAFSWGVLGAVSWFVSLILLSFCSYLCPSCGLKITNEQGRNKECPKCGSFKITPKTPEKKNRQPSLNRKLSALSFFWKRIVAGSALWALTAAWFTLIFEPFGRYMYEREFWILGKVILFPIVFGVFGCLVYLKIRTNGTKAEAEVDSEEVKPFLLNDSRDKEVKAIDLREQTKKCPYCAEEIKVEAIKCRYCRSMIQEAVPLPKENTYESFEDWLQVYKNAAASVNDSLKPEDGLCLIDLMEDEPLQRAYSAKVDPKSLGLQFGRTFNPLIMGIG